ncbi:MAG: hypothetical protein OXF74_13500, partial [Rhodobacteraceae bacterium]|nr:hypothetical protein [Paracoccaceae bacterium]
GGDQGLADTIGRLTGELRAGTDCRQGETPLFEMFVFQFQQLITASPLFHNTWYEKFRIVWD